MPNPLISDFRVPAASKGTARDIWSRETLVKGTTRGMMEKEVISKSWKILIDINKQ